MVHAAFSIGRDTVQDITITTEDGDFLYSDVVHRHNSPKEELDWYVTRPGNSIVKIVLEKLKPKPI